MPRWTTFFAAAGRRPWLLVPLLLAIAVAAWAWSRTRATPVPVLTVRAAPLTQSLAVSGRVASETRVFVGSTLTGRVAEVTRREGGTLAAGELIVRLEDAELAAAARQAAAALASAEARLVSQRRLAAPLATQQLAQAEANAAAAAREVERNEQLLAQGFIGQARLDEAKRAADVARAVLRAAQVQREANVSGSELVTAEARVTEARAALELARARLAQTRIAAPAEATVLARHVEPGQIVQPGTRLVELSVRGPLQLVALVDEKYLARLAPGMAASVVADAFPGRPFEARIASIAPLVDALRGAVEVKFSLPAPPSPPVRLTNDMTVSIEVVTAKRERAIALPGEAVRAGPAVRGVQGGAATLRPVQTGLRTLAAVEVTQGLREGEQVVLDAAIAPGARVRAVERTAAAAAGEGLDVGAAMRGLGRD
ncbi:MAG: efflux RND transporter periplasmic adaptor subunit [Burkholderiaceae bacterium]|nr:efflux RND transporter periplasmic adaptor subunit [Burkholderiaceae bacterium]